MSDRFRVNCEKNNEPIKYQRMTGIGRTATVSSCSFYRIFHSWQHRAGADPLPTVDYTNCPSALEIKVKFGHISRYRH